MAINDEMKYCGGVTPRFTDSFTRTVIRAAAESPIRGPVK